MNDTPRTDKYEARRVKQDRPWSEYPIGTKAPAIMGGAWTRVEHGWRWGPLDGGGGVFPMPGGDSDGTVILPNTRLMSALSAAESASIADAFVVAPKTPRTDEAFRLYYTPPYNFGMVELREEMQALERENAELRESVHYADGTATLALKHRDIAEAQVTELREALDVADECLSLIEDHAHGAFGTNIASARRVILLALERTADEFSTLVSATESSGTK